MNAKRAVAWAIILITIFLVFAILIDWIPTGFLIGPHRLSHWFGWSGSLFVVLYTPLFYFLRRTRIPRKNLLLNIHVYGFLIAFAIISVHYAGQLSRPPSNYPPFAEGIALMVSIILLVATGVMQQFVLSRNVQTAKYNLKTNRSLHRSLVIGFYIIIVVHMIANFYAA